MKIRVQKNIQKIFISSLSKVPCISPGHLPGDEGLSPARALVVEEDAVTGVHVVSLAIVNHRPEEWANIYRAETNECIPIFPKKRPNSDYFLKQ